ncbi:unnamed protein product [Clonostachys rhizophaga]|uniref:Uncharacterized protein n=1 Tax=Clonostachys rhizophaga TaxID=160324 RepID=A0A9N9V8U9_9HYPO|nr:unnamed protein product [Clonostachys rhizophaga]
MAKDAESDAELRSQQEAPPGGFAKLMRVFTFATNLDRLIQIGCAFAAVCSGAAMPLMALVLGRLTANFTDYGGSNEDESTADFMKSVQTNALYFVYLFIGKVTLVYIWSFGFTFAASRMVQTMRISCLDRILDRTVAANDAETPGSLSNTVTVHCNSIQAALSDRLGIMIQAFSMLLASFAVAFSQSWQLTLVMLGLVMLTLGLIGFIVSSDQRIEAGLLKRYNECSVIAEDALGSIRTVIAFGAAHKFLSKYNNNLEKTETNGKKRGPFVGLMFATQYFFMFVGWAIGFYLGAYLFTKGMISDAGRILSVFFSMLIGLGAIMALGPNMPSFIKAIAAADDAFKILDDESKQGQTSSGQSGIRDDKTDNCEGLVEFRNMSFSYGVRKNHNALDSINLSFTRGSSTAIVGPSGAGKSTLISLLERWYEPTTGSILLDGRDISGLDARWLRSQIALVQQEPQLFNASIFDNIAYGLVGTGKERLSQEQKTSLVHDACRETRAYDFITALPESFDTVVGDRASLISGGQKQRIAIARALVGRRPILLMDEATSALDNENSKVIETLMTDSNDRTTIFISHKIRSAVQAGRVIVLDHGKVVEQGTHQELMAMGGLYRRLYDAQTEVKPSDDEEPIKPASKIIDPKITELGGELAEASQPSATIKPSESLPLIPKRHLLTNLLEIAKEQKRYWPIFFVGFVACAITAQIFPVQAILLGRVMEVFQRPADQVSSDANFWSLMFFVVGLGSMISYAILGFFMTLLGVHLTRFYRLEYFRAVLHQPVEFFDQVASGTLLSRLSSDPASLHELLSINMGLLISIFISIISASIIGLAYSWKFALVAIFAAMPAVFAAGYLRMKLDSSLAEEMDKISEDSARFVSDSLSAFRTVKAFTMETAVSDMYRNCLTLFAGSLYRKRAVMTLLFAFSESVELLAAALGFWYGGKLMGDGELTTEKFFTVFIAVIIGGQAAGALFGFSSNLGKAKVAANNILGIRSQARAAADRDRSKQIAENHGLEKEINTVVDMQSVTFAYPARPNVTVLKSVSLQVQRGHTVGVVGTSGSGKSTLLALLERFYDAQSGTLNVLGMPISAHNIGEYRKRLAIVPQEPQLYNGTIRENVSLGLDEDKIQDVDVVAACEAAGLAEFISSLPDGYNTQCRGQGVSFSGGQRQRIAIARALILQPELLLLDEPTSALDAESEQLVRETLGNIQEGRTMILVTHRLNIVRDAHVIIVMDEGRIVEKGTHAELMSKQGHYFKMHQSSMGDNA